MVQYGTAFHLIHDQALHTHLEDIQSGQDFARINITNNNGDTDMPRITLNKKIKLTVSEQTMKLFNDFYTDLQFNLIKDIFCTYHNRGGVLPFWRFAMIPISKDPGKNLEAEHGEWTKYIRARLAEQGREMLK